MTITIPAIHVGFWIIPAALSLAWLVYVVVENCKTRSHSSYYDFGLDSFLTCAFQIILLVPVLISWIIWLVFK